MFIARVSKGRTIREFLIGVVLAPTLFGSLWFGAFGTTAIDIQKSGIDLTAFPTEQTLFATFSQLPFGIIMSIIAILLVSTFFILIIIIFFDFICLFILFVQRLSL